MISESELHPLPLGRVCDQLTVISAALVNAVASSPPSCSRADNPAASRSLLTRAMSFDASSGRLAPETETVPLLVSTFIVSRSFGVVSTDDGADAGDGVISEAGVGVIAAAGDSVVAGVDVGAYAAGV